MFLPVFCLLTTVCLASFDNKIFIITADHGHTAMPTDLTYRDKNWLGVEVDKPAEMSCKLKLDFGDPEKPNSITREQLAELNNNNLHIWELGEVFKAAGSIQNTVVRNKYKILAPREIETVFATAGVPIAFRSTSKSDEAHIVAALNGPMAHIYSMSG